MIYTFHQQQQRNPLKFKFEGKSFVYNTNQIQPAVLYHFFVKKVRIDVRFILNLCFRK